MRVFYDNGILRGSCSCKPTPGPRADADCDPSHHAQPDLDGGHDAYLERVPGYAVRDLGDLPRHASPDRIVAPLGTAPGGRPDPRPGPPRCATGRRGELGHGELRTRVLAPDTLTRSVWVVVDPRDAVTGARVTAPLLRAPAGRRSRPILSRVRRVLLHRSEPPAAEYIVRGRAAGGHAEQLFRRARKSSLLASVAGAVATARCEIRCQSISSRVRHIRFAGPPRSRAGGCVKASDGAPVEGAPHHADSQRGI